MAPVVQPSFQEWQRTRLQPNVRRSLRNITHSAARATASLQAVGDALQAVTRAAQGLSDGGWRP